MRPAREIAEEFHEEHIARGYKFSVCDIESAIRQAQLEVIEDVLIAGSEELALLDTWFEEEPSPTNLSWYRLGVAKYKEKIRTLAKKVEEGA